MNNRNPRIIVLFDDLALALHQFSVFPPAEMVTFANKVWHEIRLQHGGYTAETCYRRFIMIALHGKCDQQCGAQCVLLGL